MLWLHKHSADKILKGPLQMYKAEREVLELSRRTFLYAKMLKDINTFFKGKDRVETTIEFIKFVVQKVFTKAPLRLKDGKLGEGYRFILEHGEYFTFENLFPNGLHETMIKEFTGVL